MEKYDCALDEKRLTPEGAAKVIRQAAETL